MKLTLETRTLQSMLSKAIRGASQNKLLPLTSMMAIRVKEKVLDLITTNGMETLYVEADVDAEDFYIVIQIDTFSKLVSKFTCDAVTLEVTDKALKVTGNGNYTIDIPVGDDGEIIKFPDPMSDLRSDTHSQDSLISLNTIHRIADSIAPSLLTGVSASGSQYANYYIGEVVCASDSIKISALTESVLDDPQLINPNIINLLTLATEDVKFYQQDNAIYFVSRGLKVCGTASEGVERFNIEQIKAYINQKLDYACNVHRGQLIGAIERVGLFIDEWDNGEIVLTFTPENLTICSRSNTGKEVVDYMDSLDVLPEGLTFECSLHIDHLLTQVKAQSNDVISLQFGEGKAFKITDGELISVVSVISKD